MYASMVTAWSLTYGNFNVKAVKVYVLHLSEHENYVFNMKIMFQNLPVQEDITF